MGRGIAFAKGTVVMLVCIAGIASHGGAWADATPDANPGTGDMFKGYTLESSAARAGKKTPPDKKWLRQKKPGKGLHEVVVDRFDSDRGLLAGYVAPNGERLLFRAAYLAPNVPYAEILYFDDETGKVERLFPVVDPLRMTGKRRDLPTSKEIVSALQQASKAGVPQAESKAALDRLSKFADSTLARAAEDGIVALYLAIDTPNVDPALVNLVKPLGAFAMTIQIGAGGRRRTPLSSLTTSDTAAKFAHNCEQAACTMRGSLFEVDGRGFFDVLGRSKTRTKLKSTRSNSALAAKIGIGEVQPISLGRYTSGWERELPQATQEACVARAANECFGNCGIGCPSNPAELLELPECYAHDFCVCLNDENHAACLFTVPAGCVTDRGPCASLSEAVGAFLEHFFSDLLSLVTGTYGIGALLIGFFGDIVGTLLDVVVFTLDTVFDLIGDFFDWLFGDDCDEEVSPEACIGN